jgi:rubrerythrin
MNPLKGSKTEHHLKEAFSSEAQTHLRYLYFAGKADIEGKSDIADLFRSAAKGELGHALGHLDWLEPCGDPDTGLPMGPTLDNLKAAIESETRESGNTYPDMAKTARAEGFDEIADWFETLAMAERSHVTRYNKALKELSATGL